MRHAFAMFLLASLLPMLPAYAQSSAPTTITKEELAKQLPQEDAAHLDDILRLLRRNTTLFDLKRVGARKPNELPVTLFAGDGHTKWLNLRDTMTPIAWGDFFTGCLVLPGPETNGNYVWLKVDDWVRWEKKFMYGPYIHHLIGVYGDYVEAMKDACRYIGVEADTPDSPLF